MAYSAEHADLEVIMKYVFPRNNGIIIIISMAHCDTLNKPD